MTDIKELLSTINKLAEGHSANSVEMAKLRPAILELEKELSSAKSDVVMLRRRNAFLEDNDHYKDARSWEKRHGEITALKDSYAETIDKAMKCVEAVLASVCGTRKDDIAGAGAEFFANATHYLPRKIGEHVNYVKRMVSDNRCEEAETLSKTMKAERNAAVRKQLDQEIEIKALKERVRWFESNDQLKIAEERAVKISELRAELSKASGRAAEAEARANANENRYKEAVKQIEANENAARARITSIADERTALANRVTYLESISPGADSDSVSWLIRDCAHLMTPGVMDNRHHAVQCVMGLALQYPRLSKDFEAVSSANEKHLKWLDAVGKHLGLDHGVCGKWWERVDAVERLRTRVESLRDGTANAVAALKGEVERLTDVIYELRKGS
jgi:hypothetical protein